MIRYGFSQQKIENVSCIDCNANNWYNYKNLNFLLNLHLLTFQTPNII